MSTSLLYHAFGIRGYHHVICEYKKGQTLFKIKYDPWKLSYPIYKSRDFIKKGTKRRKFKALPIDKKEVFIELDAQSNLRLELFLWL